MEHKGLTLVREKGKEIPQLVLEAALLKYGTLLSVAMVDVQEDTDIAELDTYSQSLKEVDHPRGALGYIQDLLEETKENKVILHFSNEEKDPQPFPLLLDEDDDVTLIAFLIGDFSSNKETDGHTEEYTEANEYLSPKILDLYERSDEDLDKLMQKLKEPNIVKELSKMGDGDFLNVTLMSTTGDVLAFVRPTSPPIKYDWGHASQNLDEHKTTEKSPAEEPKPKGKLSLKERMALRKAGKAEAEAEPEEPAEPAKEPAEEEKPLPPGVHRVTPSAEPATGKPMGSLKERMAARKAAEAAGKPEPAEKPAENSEDLAQTLRVVKIPEKFDKQKNRRKWFSQRGMTGEVNVDFPDWMSRTDPIVVPMWKLMQLFQKRAVEDLAKLYPEASSELAKQLSAGPMPYNKSHVTGPKLPQAENKDIPGFIPTTHKQTLKEKFLSKPRIMALTNRSGQNVSNPEFLPKMEDKATPFWESLGLPSLNSTDWWERQDYKDLGSYSIDAVAAAAFDEKMYRCRLEKKVLDLQAELAKLKGEPLPSAPSEPVAAAPEAGTKKLSLKERMAARKAA